MPIAQATQRVALRVVGLGMVPLPGERRRWADSYQRAQAVFGAVGDNVAPESIKEGRNLLAEDGTPADSRQAAERTDAVDAQNSAKLREYLEVQEVPADFYQYFIAVHAGDVELTENHWTKLIEDLLQSDAVSALDYKSAMQVAVSAAVSILKMPSIYGRCPLDAEGDVRLTREFARLVASIEDSQGLRTVVDR